MAHTHLCVPEDCIMGILVGGGDPVSHRMDSRDGHLVWSMVMDAPREQIMEALEDAMFLEPDGYDVAIAGIAERCGMHPVVAYDMEKVIDILMADGMDETEAIEFFEFNTIGAWMGDLTPVFITLIKTGEK
jgi:hypothetical protein